MATNTAQREWLGLGTMGWGVYALIAIVNIAVMVSVADSMQEQATYALGVILLAYGIVRFWKFVVGLFGRLFA